MAARAELLVLAGPELRVLEDEPPLSMRTIAHRMAPTATKATNNGIVASDMMQTL